MKNPKYLAIGGCPRSGTSALTDLLNIDGRVFVTRELRLFRCWNRKVGRKTLKRKLNGKNPTSWVFQKHFLNIDHISDTFATGGQIARYVMRNTDLEYFGDKLPRWYLCNVEYLAKKFPRMKFILCLRDGRAVIASQMRLYKNMKNPRKVTDYNPIKIIDSPFIAGNIPTAQRLWIMTCEVLEKYETSQFKNRIYVVKYEEAVKKPLATIRSISGFLGIKPALSIEGHKYRPVHLNTWKKEIPNVMHRVNKRFKYYLEKYGYC